MGTQQRRRGSDGSAAGGGRSDLSEWQRSIADEAALTARKISGTATGPLWGEEKPRHRWNFLLAENGTMCLVLRRSQRICALYFCTAGIRCEDPSATLGMTGRGSTAGRSFVNQPANPACLLRTYPKQLPLPDLCSYTPV